MLLGRDDECGRVAALLDGARAGTSGVLVVRGDAGMGKTAMLADAVSRASDMTVLCTRGVESEIEMGFAGLFDLLRPVLDRLDRIPAAQAAAVRGALGLGEPISHPLAVAVGTLALLGAVADDGPVLVIVDDAHCLDRSSRACLHFIALRLYAEGIAMIWSARDAETEAAGLDDLPHLTLGGLSPAAAAELLGRTTSIEIPALVRESIVAATGGNPLALVEAPSLLSGPQLAGQDPLDDPLPVGRRLGSAYLRQVRALPPSARTALVVAAAAGDAPVEVVETANAALGLPLAALTPAEAEGMVATGGDSIQWRHPLLRAAVWRAASASERRMAHRAVASAQPADRQAWHLAAATNGVDDQVAAALARTADEARARNALAEAARGHERAAELSRDPSARASRVLVAALEYAMSGAPQQGVDLLDRASVAIGNPDPIARADAQLLRARIACWNYAPRQARDLLLVEAARVEGHDARRALVMLIDAGMISLMILAEVTSSSAIEDQAVAAARKAGRAERASAAWLRAAGLLLRGEVDEARRLGPEALTFEFDIDSLAIVSAPFLLPWLERYDECRAMLERRQAQRQERGAVAAPIELAMLAQVETWAGRWQVAQLRLGEAMRVAGATGQASVLSFVHALIARIEAVQGREADCRANCRTAMTIADRAGAEAVKLYPHGVLGLLELSRGRPAAALVHLQRLAKMADECGLAHPSVVPFRPDLVEANALAGQRDEAAKALTVLEEQAARTGLSWPAAAAARCRGLLDPEFRPHFEAALELHTVVPAPFEQARTELRFGERLRRARSIVEARHHLHSALATFAELGADPWAEMARIELRASGEHVPRTAQSPLAGLTSQELEIATRVANGEKNLEIADALQLSAKTIEFHLSKVYRKLQVRSRTDLARLFAQS